ncbi:MAG: NUDIX domain-containing protein [Pseudomonadota bacterium]
MAQNRDRYPVVVHVLVWEGGESGRLALLKRANTGFMDGYFALPGGHQDQGESVSAAAARECTEELGIEPVHLEPVCVLPYRSGRHQGVNFVFSCDRYQGVPTINEPELFSDLVWVRADALPQPLAPWIANALDAHSGGRWYQELAWD